MNGYQFYSALFLMVLLCKPAYSFDISNASIPKDEIRSGGPAKDGIPALLKPKFITAKESANKILFDDMVLGIELNGVAKAYPIKILNWHELVNDGFNGKKVVVSYCPLCGTGMAFNASAGGDNLTFGVSGLLYNSDVLFYDHQTESLWSQIKKESVAGKMVGSRLQQIPLLHTAWGYWVKKHPNTLLLSTDTGYQRDYNRNPYGSYEESDFIMFPVKNNDNRYSRKEKVLGLTINGIAKAYPFSELIKNSDKIKDKIGTTAVTINFDKKTKTAFATDNQGKQIDGVTAYWFAWVAFHPDTKVFGVGK